MIKITLYVFYSNNNYYYFHLTAISQVKLECKEQGAVKHLCVWLCEFPVKAGPAKCF